MNPERRPWWDPELGYPGDKSTRIRSYRRLQSRWREVELDLRPGSFVDKKGQERLLGSRLPEHAKPRDQLLSDEALDYASTRLPQLEAEGRKAEPHRLWHNMLSSQPLCFSLFGHLVHHRGAGARVLSSVLPWPVDTIDEVLVEHAPDQAAATLGGERSDNTAFDAMLIVRSAGDRRVLGIETKYTEPFSQKRYDKPTYRAVTNKTGSWFEPGAAEVAREPATNQLWRNLMLAQETEQALACPASVVVLTAAQDHHAEQAVAGMTPLLTEPAKVLTHTLMEEVIVAAEAEPTLAAWATRFRHRYLDLELAEIPG